MLYQIAAHFIVILHLAFILFVIFGGLLVLKWRWLIWLHIPAVIWGALISFMGWVCPLTPLENRLRNLAGDNGYSTGFIEHYLIPVIYPDELKPFMFVLMGVVVLLVNFIVYSIIFRKK